MKLLLVLFLASTLSQAAEFLRISAVAESASPEAESMTYKTPDGQQQLWVSKEAILTEKDVKEAFPSPAQEKTEAGPEIRASG